MLVSTEKSALGILVGISEDHHIYELPIAKQAKNFYEISFPFSKIKKEIILIFDFDIKKIKIWEENSFGIEKYDYGYVKFDVWAENVEKYSNAENPTIREYLKNSIPVLLDFDIRFLEEKRSEKMYEDYLNNIYECELKKST